MVRLIRRRSTYVKTPTMLLQYLSFRFDTTDAGQHFLFTMGVKFLYSWFFHVTSEKPKIKSFKFLTSSCKSHFETYISFGQSSARKIALFWKWNTVFHNAWHRHCFWVTCYVHENIDSPYVFEFNRENKRFERAKVNSKCFHWFPAAMLESQTCSNMASPC